MSTTHLLNVQPGGCAILRHNSGRTTMVDICDGNLAKPPYRAAHTPTRLYQRDCFRMCQSSTNPIAYAQGLGITSIFRFILTHPDMDHMDGFDNLMDEIGVTNFWDTGSRRDTPDFSGGCFQERDWDRYVSVRDGREIATRIRQAGDRFGYANNGNDHDGLYILAPDAELIRDSDMDDDINEGSYVILYRSAGGRILLPGDAHDVSWAYVRQHYANDVANCSFLVAPHHGRDSDRSYDFLDLVRPQLTLLGCCPSEYIDYAQWTRRGLPYITSNECGNVVLDAHDNVIDVFVENVDFAVAEGGSVDATNDQGYAWLGRIEAVAQAARAVAVRA
jgi:beta-lactamase superfamily II metal-dependent hydrolase